MKLFDLEQQLLDCWRVTDDIDLITKWFVDDPSWEGMDPKVQDAMMNKYFAIKELYDLKFEQCWQTFEAVCHDYHKLRQGNLKNESEETFQSNASGSTEPPQNV